MADKEKILGLDGFFTALGAKGIIESGIKKENKHSSFSYKTSQSLIENVISKKDLTLFSELETEGKLAITSTSREYTDRKGKRINLTPFQLKLVTAFAQVVDTMLNEEGVKEYVNELPYEIRSREEQRDSKGCTKKLPNSIRCVIDIPKLTKLMYSNARVGGKQADKVREEINKLSELLQVYKFKDKQGGTLTIEAPIITLGKRIKYETKNGVVKLNKVEVYFEDVFVYEINDKFSLSPITLLQLWNNTGVQTELFTMLLFLLQSVRGNYIKHSKEAVEAKRLELKKKKVETEEIRKQLKQIKREKLTYRESITSILERVDSKKYYVNGKYLHAKKLEKDLAQAKEALLLMGIIKEYYESTGATGDRVCNFVINDRWLINEANKIKQLLPQNEQPAEEDKEVEREEEVIADA